MRTFERLRAQHANAMRQRKWKRAGILFMQMHDETMSALRKEIEAERVERQMIDDDLFHISGEHRGPR